MHEELHKRYVPPAVLTWSSQQIDLIPAAASRILVNDVADAATGRVSVLNAGDTVGPATVGREWSDETQLLLKAVFYYPNGFPDSVSGPLAATFLSATPKTHAGVRFRSPDGEHFGWLAWFATECLRPGQWGWTRIPDTAVAAADPATLPPIRLETFRVHPGTWELRWQPAFSGIVIEETILRLNPIWTPVESSLLKPTDTPAGEVHVYRVRPVP